MAMGKAESLFLFDPNPTRMETIWRQTFTYFRQTRRFQASTYGYPTHGIAMLGILCSFLNS